MARITVKVPGFRCERCKHEWIPRIKIKEDPIICPTCKSPDTRVEKENRITLLKCEACGARSPLKGQYA